jgi:hypothetical protein
MDCGEAVRGCLPLAPTAVFVVGGVFGLGPGPRANARAFSRNLDLAIEQAETKVHGHAAT